MVVLRRWAPWILLVLVAVGALIYGLQRSSHPSLDARVNHIAGEVRCPVCNGETAAQSDSSASVAIRNQIRQDLQAGQSESQILASLVHSYGSGILEKPQPTGIGLLVWVLPVVVIAGMVAVLLVTFSRWRARAAVSAPDPQESVPSPEVAAPVVAAASTLAPGLAPAPVPVPSEPAPVPSEPAPVPSEAAPVPSRRRALSPKARRRLFIAAGAAVMTGAASWAVVDASSTRLAGQTITGATLGPQAEVATLQKAQQEAAKGQDLDAIKDYEKVLKSDPNQAVALTGAGWLLVQTQQPSLLQQGIAMLAQAEKSDPSYSPAHVYRGIAFLSEGDYAESIPELQWYLAHNPDPQLLSQVRTALQTAETGLKSQSAAAPPTTGP